MLSGSPSCKKKDLSVVVQKKWKKMHQGLKTSHVSSPVPIPLPFLPPVLPSPFCARFRLQLLVVVHARGIGGRGGRVAVRRDGSSVSRSGPVRFFSLFWTRPGPVRSPEISFLGKNRTGLGKTVLHRSGLRYLSTFNRLKPRPV